MCGSREPDLIGNLAPVANQEHPLPHLRHTVERCIQQRICADVPFIIQDLACFLRDVLAAVVQNVRYVFHQHSKWLAGLHVA